MNKRWKYIASLLIAVLLLSVSPIAALAANPTVTFYNGSVGSAPGSAYTSSDLFDGFKGVMPGDTLSETITIRNSVTDYNSIKVYLRAQLHDDAGNPISPAVLSELQADGRLGSMPELAYMLDFLSKLSLTVYNGASIIYQSSPDMLDGLASDVYLGSISKGGSLTLDVLLQVPLDLDNSYAGRIGEVDWIFTAEASDNRTVTVYKRWSDNGKDRPTSVTATLYNGNTAVETVELGDWNNWTYTWRELSEQGKWRVRETNVPKGYTAAYRTNGDMTTIINSRGLIQTGQLYWPVPVLAVLGALLIGYGLVLARRNRKNEKI